MSHLSVRAALLLGLALLCPGRAAAEPFPKDPVEAFRHALKSTDETKQFARIRSKKSPALNNAIAFRQAKLKEAEKQLQSIGELSAALLLVEWPSRVPRLAVARAGSVEGYVKEILSPYERDARQVELELRQQMVKRLNDAVQRVLNDTRARPAARIAVANLVGDMASAAEEVDDVDLSLYAPLAPLADDLRRLAERSEDPEVRAAVARALGRFPKRPAVVAQTVRHLLLGRGATERERLAAATALVAVVQAVTGSEPLRASEPGVGRREVARGERRRFEAGFRDELLAVVREVVPVAAVATADRSAPVRAQGTMAMARAAAALLAELAVELQELRDEVVPPADKQRVWDERERQRVRELHASLRETMKQYTPALEAYARIGPALARTVVDRDERVRLEARRTLEHLGRIRRLLADLGAAVPPERPPAKDGKKGDITRLTRVAAQDEQDGLRKNERLIGDLLRKIGRELAESGFSDPDPRGRRAVLETVEAYGELALEYLPRVVNALDDRDVIVRWIAARALARTATTAEPGKAPGARLAVPALVRRLTDQDLDARIAAIRALGAYGTQADDAVPALTAALERGDVESRVATMKALESIGTASAPALPALARSLAHIDPRVRTEALRVIGRFGSSPRTRPAVQAYLPQLQRMTTDRDADVRRAAAGAITSITSE